jgi:hypothetical protein
MAGLGQVGPNGRFIGGRTGCSMSLMCQQNATQRNAVQRHRPNQIELVWRPQGDALH